MSKQNFDAVLERPEGHKEAAFVTIPFDVEEVFGTRGRVPIKALIDGEPYRGSLAPMGGCHCLGVLKAIRNKLGKKHGETVHVELERDTEERTISQKS